MSIKACNNGLTRFVEKKADESASCVGSTSLLDPQVILQKETGFIMAMHRIQVYSNPPLPSSVDQAAFKIPFLTNNFNKLAILILWVGPTTIIQRKRHHILQGSVRETC